jgi:hypothetical protein
MLNVKYVLSAEELPYRPELQHLEQLDGVSVYENLEAGDRAFLVTDVQNVSPETVLPTLLSPDFNWRQSALITESLPAEQEAQLAAGSPATGGEVNITRYEPQEITIVVGSSDTAFLVLADAYYPGWQALLDGRPVPVYETNEVLRGVFVPAGTHEIQFQFRPRILQIALVLALFGTVIALGVVALTWRRQIQPTA